MALAAVVAVLMLVLAACLLSSSRSDKNRTLPSNREDRIRLAAERLRQTYGSAFDTRNYDQIEIESDAHSFTATFRASALYVPRNKSCIYQLYVTMSQDIHDGGTTGIQSSANREDGTEPRGEIFVHTAESRKAIALVRDAFGSSDFHRSPSPGGVPSSETWIVKDRGATYEVKILSRGGFELFVVEKSSGEVTQTGHGDTSAVQEGSP